MLLSRAIAHVESANFPVAYCGLKIITSLSLRFPDFQRWWASMGEPRGSEPGYNRPVIIVSSNEFNQSLIQTVIVVVVTSNLRLVDAPGNFKITKKQSNLNKDSVVNVSQLITLDKTFLTEQVGKLNSKYISHLNEGVRLVLGV